MMEPLTSSLFLMSLSSAIWSYIISNFAAIWQEFIDSSYRYTRALTNEALLKYSRQITSSEINNQIPSL